MANDNLTSAKKAKNDEFYTQYEDIEKEINAYFEYDNNVFTGKTVLLPCDDPEWSNFTKYFAQNFKQLGLKKLISTSYALNSNPEIKDPQTALFEFGTPEYNEVKTRNNGKIFTLTKDITEGGEINFKDFQWEYLEGDGDFRSEEITNLRDEADIIVTNAPFSLFKNFILWALEGKKQFLTIGNMNAITYKEIFPMIKENKIWLGATGNSSDMVFRVPKHYQIKPSDREKAAKLGYVGDYTRLGNSCWFTNLQHGTRHTFLKLDTIENNIKNHTIIKNTGYLKYDNIKAIEIPRVDAIPNNYDGIMGVPISFLNKYNPDQFEIIAITNKDTIPKNLLISGHKKYDRPYLNGRRMYSRILIRKKKR